MEEEKSIVPLPENPDHMEHSVGGSIIVECILKICGWRVVIGFMWLRI
jgi:hypothetical protein